MSNVMKDDLLQGFLKVLAFYGGNRSEIARQLGITPQSVQGWGSKGEIPIGRVLKLEALTGISRRVIRPDLYTPTNNEAS